MTVEMFEPQRAALRPTRPHTAGTGRSSAVRLLESSDGGATTRGAGSPTRPPAAAAASAAASDADSFWEGASDIAASRSIIRRGTHALSRPRSAGAAAAALNGNYKVPTTRFGKCTCGKGCWCSHQSGVRFGKSGAVGEAHIPKHVTPHGLGMYATGPGERLTSTNKNTTGYFDRERVRGGRVRRDAWQSGVVSCAEQPRTLKGGTFARSARVAGWYATGGNSNTSAVQSQTLNVITRDPFASKPNYFLTSQLPHQFARGERGEPVTRSKVHTELPPARRCHCNPTRGAWTRTTATTLDATLPTKASSGALRIGC